MPNLNLDLNYPDHPKTRRLKAMLGKEAEFLPVKLWLYAGRIHPESGRLGDLNGAEIEGLVEWWGTPGAFIEAMERVDWLKKDEKNRYQISGWKDHQGHLVAFKRRGEIAAKARWNKDKRRRASSMQQAMLEGQVSNAPTNQAKPTKLTNQTKLTLGATAEPPPADDKSLSQDDWLKMLAADPAYSGMDVPTQFARMVRWCKENGKQATRRRFVNWLNRCDQPVKTSATTTDHSKGF